MKVETLYYEQKWKSRIYYTIVNKITDTKSCLLKVYLSSDHVQSIKQIKKDNYDIMSELWIKTTP